MQLKIPCKLTNKLHKLDLINIHDGGENVKPQRQLINHWKNADINGHVRKHAHPHKRKEEKCPVDISGYNWLRIFAVWTTSSGNEYVSHVGEKRLRLPKTCQKEWPEWKIRTQKKWRIFYPLCMLGTYLINPHQQTLWEIIKTKENPAFAFIHQSNVLPAQRKQTRGLDIHNQEEKLVRSHLPCVKSQNWLQELKESRYHPPTHPPWKHRHRRLGGLELGRLHQLSAESNISGFNRVW